MDKNKEILDLATLFFDSYMYPTNFAENKGFKDFVIKTCIDSSVCLDKFDSEEELKDNWEEAIEDNPTAWLVLYLYSKDYISKGDLRNMLKGKEFRTSCFGDYINFLEKEFGVIINKKDKEEKQK